jgi:lysophospholipase L1-like esterase
MGTAASRGPDGRSHVRVVAQRLTLVAAGLLLPLLALEAFLRLGGAVVPGEYQTTSFLEAHPEFGRRNRPGQGWKRTSEFTSWIQINSRGLRGSEIAYEKPAGELRVLVLGDSFTFAEQVNQHETFSSLLEQRLNADGRPGTVRVLNAGSNGWATANELVFLAEEGVKYQPDLVVLALYLDNDVPDNYRRVAEVRDAERADLALRGADAFDGPRRILRRSMLYTVLETGVFAKLPWGAADASSDAALRPGPRTAAEAAEAWEITARLLRRMRDITEDQGAEFVVMVVPSLSEVAAGPRVREPGADPGDDEVDDEPGFEDRHASLAEIADRLGLRRLDLLSAFLDRTARSEERLYYRANAHWTAAGHALAAEELHGFLTGSGLIAAR